MLGEEVKEEAMPFILPLPHPGIIVSTQPELERCDIQGEKGWHRQFEGDYPEAVAQMPYVIYPLNITEYLLRTRILEL